MNKLFCQAWSNAAELASAYQIGKAESEAAMALLQEVEPSIVDRLVTLVQYLGNGWSNDEWLEKSFIRTTSLYDLTCHVVLMICKTDYLRQHTMGRFLTHESIQEGAFNRDRCGASNAMSAWQDALMNTTPVLELLCDRLKGDWLSTPHKFRRAWSFQQIEPWCICFCNLFTTSFNISIEPKNGRIKKTLTIELKICGHRFNIGIAFEAWTPSLPRKGFSARVELFLRVWQSLKEHTPASMWQMKRLICSNSHWAPTTSANNLMASWNSFEFGPGPASCSSKVFGPASRFWIAGNAFWFCATSGFAKSGHLPICLQETRQEGSLLICLYASRSCFWFWNCQSSWSYSKAEDVRRQRQEESLSFNVCDNITGYYWMLLKWHENFGNVLHTAQTWLKRPM